MTDLRPPGAEHALAEHLAAVRPEGREWATPYHETVDGLRRELAQSAQMFDRIKEPYLTASAERFEAKRAGQNPDPLPESVRDAGMAALLAGSYAYTLAAVLKVAGERFGDEVARTLACIADNILTNGDDNDRNADVWPEQTAEATS